jgi:hypothetical protein
VLINDFTIHQGFLVPLKICHLFEKLFVIKASVLEKAVDALVNDKDCCLFRRLIEIFVKIVKLALESSLLK